jgi:hypothetical protein
MVFQYSPAGFEGIFYRESVHQLECNPKKEVKKNTYQLRKSMVWSIRIINNRLEHTTKVLLQA